MYPRLRVMTPRQATLEATLRYQHVPAATRPIRAPTGLDWTARRNTRAAAVPVLIYVRCHAAITANKDHDLYHSRRYITHDFPYLSVQRLAFHLHASKWDRFEASFKFIGGDNVWVQAYAANAHRLPSFPRLNVTVPFFVACSMLLPAPSTPTQETIAT